MAQQDVVSELVGDHREVEDIFARLESRHVPDPQDRRDLVDDVIMELVRHSVAEESYLYPAVREHVPGGPALADTEIAEHQQAEQLMKHLDGLDVTDSDFDPVLRRLMVVVRDHIADEENDLFPKLVENCSASLLVDLGERVRRMKRIAPTRPQPSTPGTGPSVTAADGGLVGRMRDALTGRGSPVGG